MYLAQDVQKVCDDAAQLLTEEAGEPDFIQAFYGGSSTYHSSSFVAIGKTLKNLQ